MNLIVSHVRKTLNSRVENWINEMIQELRPEYIILVVQVYACIEKVLDAKSRIPLLLPLVALPRALFRKISVYSNQGKP